MIVNESCSSSGDSRNGRRGEGERDVVGERVARVVGGMQQQQQQHHHHHHQQQHRLALAVSILELPCSRNPGNENGYAVAVVEVVSSSRDHDDLDDLVHDGGGVGADAGGMDSTAESAAASPCSAFPPLSPSPSPQLPSPVLGSGVSSKNTSSALSKLGRRVRELRSRLSGNGLHRRWWQRRLKNKYSNPCDHILSSCSRRLQRINQRIEIITKKHEVLRYDKIAEKYLHWENHLREQMMIRRWGTRKNVELDRERRSDLAKLEHLKKRRDVLVKMISAKGL